MTTEALKVQRLTIEADLSRVAEVRRFVAAAGEEAGLSAERCFELKIAVSEAAANAIEHAEECETVEVKTLLFPDRLEVHVVGSGEFRLPTGGADRDHRGLGLPLMATLSDHLALYSQPDGGTLVVLTFFRPGVERQQSEPEVPLPPTQIELEEENLLLAAIVNSAPLGICVLDSDLRFRWANAAFRSFLDEPEKSRSLEGRRLTDVVPVEVKALETVIRIGEPLERRSVPYRGFERGVTYWNVRALPLKSADQLPPYDVLLLVSEVTDEVTAKRQVEVLSRPQKGGQAEVMGERLNGLNRILNSDRPLETALRLVLSEAVELMEVDGAELLLKRDSTWMLATGVGPQSEDEERALDAAAVRASEEACRTGNLQVVEDTRQELHPYNELGVLRGVRGFLIAPLTVRGERVGTLNFLNFSQPCCFSAAQIDFAENLAASISLAMENDRLASERARALRELREAHRLSETLNQIGLQVYSTLESGKIIRSMLEQGAEALEVESALLAYMDRGEWVIAHAQGFPGAQAGSRLAPKAAELSVAALSAQAPLVISEGEWSDEPGRGRLEELGLKSLLAVPVRQHWSAPGVMLFGRKEQAGGFSSSEVHFATGLAATVTVALENADRYERQESIANALQEAVFRLPDSIPGLEVDFLYRSATESARVGGDFYDVFQVSENVVGVLIGDVCGHGVQAASLASLVRDTVRAYAFQGLTLDVTLGWANEALLRQADLLGFTTVFIGLLDIKTGRLEYSSAGHPPAVLRRADGRVQTLELFSPPLGALPGAVFRVAEDELGEGDVLLLYTDGLLEARSNGSFYGEDRLAEMLRRRGGSVRGLPGLVLKEVVRFSRGNLRDDVAVLAVTRKGGLEAAGIAHPGS
ncbi:MAG: hypothetical protein Kow00129_06970 [Thermoleophilia bacterium]